MGRLSNVITFSSSDAHNGGKAHQGQNGSAMDSSQILFTDSSIHALPLPLQLPLHYTAVRGIGTSSHSPKHYSDLLQPCFAQRRPHAHVAEPMVEDGTVEVCVIYSENA